MPVRAPALLSVRPPIFQSDTSDDEHLELAAQGRGSWEADPALQTPMWGFYYSSAMWRVAGKVLTMRERDTAIPPTPTAILARVAELDMVIEELDDLFLDCPSWLALNLDAEIGSPDLPLGSVNTPAGLPPLKQGIGVQQSNLWITQLAIRLVAVQYRKELVDMRWATPAAAAALAADPANPDVLGRRPGFRAAKLRENEESFRDDRDHILSSLLRILQALPMDQIGAWRLTQLTPACNSFPGLQKIRYIASTLLSDFDEASAPPADADEASRRSFKALTYLRESGWARRRAPAPTALGPTSADAQRSISTTSHGSRPCILSAPRATPRSRL